MQIEQWKEYLDGYPSALLMESKAESTVRKYTKDVQAFLTFASGLTGGEEDAVKAYSSFLKKGYKASTSNSYLISLNQFLTFIGKSQLRVPLEKLQTHFSLENELTVQEYRKLLQGFLSSGDIKFYLASRTIAGMGLRVSELRYITPDAVKKGWAEVAKKRKVRQVFFSNWLQQELGDYCAREGIHAGPIFRSHQGDGPVNHSLVWRHLKKAAKMSGVDEAKAYPHNLRHLFARVYMETYGDIVDLADILGHSSIETTRIYTRTSTSEKIRRISGITL